MSTEIRSAMGRVRLTGDGAAIGVETTKGVGDAYGVMRAVTRADFLAAVAKECGVIVIDRADLPPVEVDRDGNTVAGLSMMEPDRRTPSLARHMALGYCAIAEYLDAHPTVDEAQVEALTEALVAADDAESQRLGREATHHEIARRLVAEGWSK